MSNSIKQFKFKSGAKLQVEVVPLKTLMDVNKAHLISPHRTDFYHIFLFDNCNPSHLVDFKIVEVKPYSLLFINKDRVHQFDQLKKYVGSLIIFTEDFFCRTQHDLHYLRHSVLFNDLTDKPDLPLSKPQYEKFKKLSIEIDEESKNPDNQTKHNILKNLVHNFLLYAEQEKQYTGVEEVKRGSDYNTVLQFRDLLDVHFIESKNVGFYSEQLNISEKKLGKSTFAVFGKTPKILIDERIILEAKRLLVHERQSVKEIGFNLGFEETTNFIKYFRKHTNKTPLEFRESYLTRKQ